MSSTPSLEVRVREYITSNFHIPSSYNLTPDTSLLDTGILDSTQLLDVFSWIKDEFDVQVADAEMIPSNFETIANITAYLQRKLG